MIKHTRLWSRRLSANENYLCNPKIPTPLNFCQCNDRQPCSCKSSLWNNRTHGAGISSFQKGLDYKASGKQNREEEKAESLGLLSADEIKQIKKQARKIIPHRVEFWANKIGVTYGRIAIRLQSSRWGSCSVDGNLNFNCLLVIMPPEIMDSVVVHELCHRRHMNHSKEFYAEIDRVFTDYKRCNKWLKDNGGVYLKRVSFVVTTV